ncbi:MAG TPA: hypothetical protein DHO02_02855 [Syntrophaceae bacterium]|jgi:uncharacterized protein (DUF169 family)|nr:hypothetical protein [Syntrophaceae bacterium]
MDLKQVNDTLNTYIRPQTFSVAIKLFTAQEALPAKVKIPVKDLGYQIALCQAWGLSRRYGWTVAVGKDDQCCIGGHVAMGFMDNPPQIGSGDAENRHESGTYAYMASAPIDRADFEPDMICLYVNSAQAMRLAQSAVNGGGGYRAHVCDRYGQLRRRCGANDLNGSEPVYTPFRGKQNLRFHSGP